MASYYRATLSKFLADDPKRILGELTAASSAGGFLDLKHRQTKAWQRELVVLEAVARSLISASESTASWNLFLEYPIPRRQKRIDAVMLAGSLIFCLEFKTEDKDVTKQTQRQVEDYALDLRDFHEASRGRRIVPVAVAFAGESSTSELRVESTVDLVRPVVATTAGDLAEQLLIAFRTESDPSDSPIDASAWDESPYRPVPTIVEAAEALYAGHNVREIAHSHAGAINLTQTSEKLVELIQEAQRNRTKIACFVTGVPGAGKTLAGLNVVHSSELRQDGRPAPVLLSGNYPLVKIVTAAIARDARRRKKENGAARTTGTLVQNANAFFREALEKPDRPPAENVVVFDEAQRAWDAEKNEKKNGQSISQPDSMLSIMDRHTDWAVLVALIGGGQEIHSGEAGLAAWGQALRSKYPHWQIAAPPEALDGDVSLSGQRLFPETSVVPGTLRRESALHLNVCLRSYRAKRVAEWVEAVLRRDADAASGVMPDLTGFPLVFTRSLESARAWLRSQTRGLRRSGLVASSSAVRLRAHGIELSSGFRQENRDMYVNWFLAETSDVRASNQLEVAASEFECQGLELDWVGVCWGGDVTIGPENGGWAFRNFSGSKWGVVKNERDRRYLLNTYRVLLTRAREGMVVWIPIGDPRDSTRPTEPMDATAAHLRQCGLMEI
jgi:DUF2075 family protein